MVAGLLLLHAAIFSQTCTALHHLIPGLPARCLQIPIVNPGAAPLSVTADCRGEAFSGPRTFEVPPGSTVGYPLTFSAPWIGEYAGALEMNFAATGGVPASCENDRGSCLPACHRQICCHRWGKGCCRSAREVTSIGRRYMLCGLAGDEPCCHLTELLLPQDVDTVSGCKAPTTGMPHCLQVVSPSLGSGVKDVPLGLRRTVIANSLFRSPCRREEHLRPAGQGGRPCGRGPHRAGLPGAHPPGQACGRAQRGAQEGGRVQVCGGTLCVPGGCEDPALYVSDM